MAINDPKQPKIVCIANNPQVSNIYSTVISLYLNTLQKLLKKQEEQPCGILLEEFANISWHGVDKFLSVCRSYLVSVTLVIQDASQLILHYGKQQADVILFMVGNIISGQLDYAIPQATIAALSSGEVVGMVADNPNQRIPQKMFHSN